MTSLADKQAVFTAAIEPMMTRLAAGKKVYGVSLVPIHVYSAGHPELIGKKCMVLGKENNVSIFAFEVFQMWMKV